VSLPLTVTLTVVPSAGSADSSTGLGYLEHRGVAGRRVHHQSAKTFFSTAISDIPENVFAAIEEGLSEPTVACNDLMDAGVKARLEFRARKSAAREALCVRRPCRVRSTRRASASGGAEAGRRRHLELSRRTILLVASIPLRLTVVVAVVHLLLNLVRR
jgi:hypothetical protein